MFKEIYKQANEEIIPDKSLLHKILISDEKYKTVAPVRIKHYRHAIAAAAILIICLSIYMYADYKSILLEPTEIPVNYSDKSKPAKKSDNENNIKSTENETKKNIPVEKDKAKISPQNHKNLESTETIAENKTDQSLNNTASTLYDSSEKAPLPKASEEITSEENTEAKSELTPVLSSENSISEIENNDSIYFNDCEGASQLKLNSKKKQNDFSISSVNSNITMSGIPDGYTPDDEGTENNFVIYYNTDKSQSISLIVFPSESKLSDGKEGTKQSVIDDVEVILSHNNSNYYAEYIKENGRNVISTVNIEENQFLEIVKSNIK